MVPVEVVLMVILLIVGPHWYRWLLRSAVVIQLGPTGRKIAPSGDGHQNNFQNRDTRLRAGIGS